MIFFSIFNSYVSSFLALNKPFTPFVTVTTDLGSAHRTWFRKEMVATYIPSIALKKLAKKEGLSDDQLLYTGLPLRSSFWNGPAPKKQQEKLKETLKIKKDDKIVFIMGGGDGVGGLEKISRSIYYHLPVDSSMIVLCGKDESVKNRLKTIFKHDNRVKVLPFSNKISKFSLLNYY